MAVRSCRVTIQDLEGITHAVEVTAETLYEAVAQGLAALRRSDWVAGFQQGIVKVSELTAEKWKFSLGSKLMGQINLVQEAIPFINEKGSFTLVSGVLNEEPIFAGVAGATVSGALEGFVWVRSFPA